MHWHGGTTGASPSQQHQEPRWAPPEPQHCRCTDGLGAARCGAELLRSVLLVATPKGSHRSSTRSRAGIKEQTLSWPKACKAPGSRAPCAHGWLLRSSSLVAAGRDLSSALQTRGLFAPVCAVAAARLIPPFGSPTKQSFAQRCCCTPCEEALGSLSRFPCGVTSPRPLGPQPAVAQGFSCIRRV